METRQATKRQLWALYCITKVDHRDKGLTMQQASDLIAKYNNKEGKSESSPSKRDNKLESEFIEHMRSRIGSMIATARQAIKIKSIVEDDPQFLNGREQKRYAFFGYGCGISIIEFDKRSKVGKQILELSSKHHYKTFLDMFLKGFTTKEIRYFENVGSPLSALFAQDIRISRDYQSAVMSFMMKKGVKKLHLKTFDD